MVTPYYKLPELIPGSLQLTAYNDRLSFLESLYGDIPVKGIYDSHVIADFTPNHVHIVSDSPTNVSSNWYRTKANNYHLNVDNIIKFIEPSKARYMRVKYGEAIRYDNDFTFDEYSSQEILLNTANLAIATSTLCKTNFVKATATGTRLTITSAAIDIEGIAYVVNSGTQPFSLCLNNTSTCSAIAVGQKAKVILVGSLLQISN